MRPRSALAAAAIAVVALALSAPAAHASIDTTFANGTLTVTGGDAADDITVGCSAGVVLVNGTDVGVACDAVRRLEVRGGAAPDRVDLGAVTGGSFASLSGARAWGEDGDDVLLGSPLADRLDGGPGADVLRGSAGNDRLTPGGGGGEASGGGGTDRVVVSGPGPWLFDDGEIIVVDPREETAISRVEVIAYIGTADADTVNAVNFRGVVLAKGGGGDDLLYSGSGDDRLVGADGDDDLSGGPGDDRLIGKDGNDFLSGGDGDDLLVGGRGSDFCLSGPGNDRNRSC